MDTLLLPVVALALAAIYFYLERQKLKRYIAQRKTLEAGERQERAAYWSRILDRLQLRKVELPNPNSRLYSAMSDLYDLPEFMAYPQRLKWARDNDLTYVYYWDVESIDELYDGELINLWLAGIIECPKT